jgi:ubiquinone/menaquinone biosynthesis C-methylase UbiE
MERLMETGAYRSLRPLLWGLVEGENILEVGVGTGRNMPYYLAQARITAIDLSPCMLQRARKRATELGCAVVLREMDVQELDFLDHSFDAVVSTFVFSSVPSPITGLREIRRVLRPGGRL